MVLPFLLFPGLRLFCPFILYLEAGRSMVLPFLQIGDSWFSLFLLYSGFRLFLRTSETRLLFFFGMVFLERNC